MTKGFARTPGWHRPFAPTDRSHRPSEKTVEPSTGALPTAQCSLTRGCTREEIRHVLGCEKLLSPSSHYPGA